MKNESPNKKDIITFNISGAVKGSSCSSAPPLDTCVRWSIPLAVKRILGTSAHRMGLYYTSWSGRVVNKYDSDIWAKTLSVYKYSTPQKDTAIGKSSSPCKLAYLRRPPTSTEAPSGLSARVASETTFYLHRDILCERAPSSAGTDPDSPGKETQENVMSLPDMDPGIFETFVIDYMYTGKIQKQPDWLLEGYIFAVDYRVLGLRDHIVCDFYWAYVWGDEVELPAYQLVSRAFKALSPERMLTTQVATVFTVRDSQMVKVSAKGGIYNAAFSPTFGNGEGAPDAADHAHGITIKLQKELGPGFTSGHWLSADFSAVDGNPFTNVVHLAEVLFCTPLHSKWSANLSVVDGNPFTNVFRLAKFSFTAMNSAIALFFSVVYRNSSLESFAVLSANETRPPMNTKPKRCHPIERFLHK
ncbi:hypothetical protein BFW01_g10852 [Lasiodiplodia theobromae]|uniref:BTB domain-containing protein n=1 Tax=Lasiodiplodia theobromae TaxID=45133 RepID=A0A8H7MAP7_9PEZI|nr:hypothetical protein BFW01_g10852 [Lasiodiplodia theobromae]